MEQQKGQKRPMVENDHPVVEGQHFDAPSSQKSIHQQDRVQQGPSLLNKVPNFHQNDDKSSSLSRATFEPGKGALLVADYLYMLRNRAKDNNEQFWRTFVTKFFAPGAKNKLCISGTSVVSPQDHWCCDICKHNSTNGIEVDILPSLFIIQYESGTLEERWLIERPNEYQNRSGLTILDYDRAVQETIYENLRVVHEGQLRVVLAPDLKIYSWSFCVRQFEELLPKTLINPQLIQLREVARRFHSDAQNASSDSSAQLLKDDYERFLKSVHELINVLNPPLDRNFGYSKRYVQSLQIGAFLAGESMKKIMEYSKRTGASPVESLKSFRSMSNQTPGNELKIGHTVQLPLQFAFTGSSDDSPPVRAPLVSEEPLSETPSEASFSGSSSTVQ